MDITTHIMEETGLNPEKDEQAERTINLIRQTSEEANIPIDEVLEEINKKIKAMNMMISIHGAAHAVAKNHGVNVISLPPLADFNDIEVDGFYNILGVVSDVFDTSGKSEVKKGPNKGVMLEWHLKKITVMNAVTDEIDVVCFDKEGLHKLNNVKAKDILLFRSVVADEREGQTQLRYVKSSSVEINPKLPEGISFPEPEPKSRGSNLNGKKITIMDILSTVTEDNSVYNFELNVVVSKLSELKKTKKEKDYQTFTGVDEDGNEIRIKMFNESLVKLNENDNISVNGKADYSEEYGFGISCFKEGDIKINKK
jgi:hypothetical protein